MFVWRNDEIGTAWARGPTGGRPPRSPGPDQEGRCGGDVRADRDEPQVVLSPPAPTLRRWKFPGLGLTFPDTYVEDDFDDEVGAAVMSHPNVEIDWVHHTHTKYYILMNA
ncbi:MAG: hypothetical protein Ct9H300mP1_02600 [Planctomycetaceae bacterium]|nr:MAG: hypothetical protein Ct9H300mP1_02600 [Planctomycetaceae bacterium]